MEVHAIDEGPEVRRFFRARRGRAPLWRRCRLVAPTVLSGVAVPS